LEDFEDLVDFEDALWDGWACPLVGALWIWEANAGEAISVALSTTARVARKENTLNSPHPEKEIPETFRSILMESPELTK